MSRTLILDSAFCVIHNMFGLLNIHVAGKGEWIFCWMISLVFLLYDQVLWEEEEWFESNHLRLFWIIIGLWYFYWKICFLDSFPRSSRLELISNVKMLTNILSIWDRSLVESCFSSSSLLPTICFSLQCWKPSLFNFLNKNFTRIFFKALFVKEPSFILFPPNEKKNLIKNSFFWLCKKPSILWLSS